MKTRPSSNLSKDFASSIPQRAVSIPNATAVTLRVSTNFTWDKTERTASPQSRLGTHLVLPGCPVANHSRQRVNRPGDSFERPTPLSKAPNFSSKRQNGVVNLEHGWTTIRSINAGPTTIQEINAGPPCMRPILCGSAEASPCMIRRQMR